MSRKIDISVIIPTKSEEVRKELLESIKSNTEEAKLETEVIIVKGENVQKNRNEGANKAKGEYLFFCDDDITLYPGCLGDLHGALISHSECSYAYGDFTRSGHFKGLFTSFIFDPERLKNHNYISTMSLLRAKDFPGFNESLERLQDWDLWLTLLEQGKIGIYVAKTLFNAHYTDKGISARGKEDALKAEETVRALHQNL